MHIIKTPVAQKPAPKISGYLYTKDCLHHGYPFKEAIMSLAGFCDEVVVLDGESMDGTWETLDQMEKFQTTYDGRVCELRFFQHEYDKSIPAIDGAFKQLTRMMCRGELLFQLDADEIVHESGYDIIMKFAREWNPDWNGVSFANIDLAGANDKAIFWNQGWKWRLSRNHPWLGHGIADVPGNRWRNEKGQTGAKHTDGCEFIDFRNGQFVPFETYYTQELEALRTTSPWNFPLAMNQIVWKHVPTIWHYSWADVYRKLKLARDSWNGQWDNLRGQPAAENPDVKGKTDEELKEMAKTWFDEHKDPGVVIARVDMKPPKIMEAWEKEHGLR